LCRIFTTGSVTGARLDFTSIVVDLKGARDAVPWEAGKELRSSNPTVLVEKSDRGALIKLIDLGATSQFRKKYGQN
jgi:hypothetical protein